MVPCGKCNAYFETQGGLNAHQAVHSVKPKKEYSCKKCKKVFTHHLPLAAHMARGHLTTEERRAAVVVKTVVSDGLVPITLTEPLRINDKTYMGELRVSPELAGVLLYMQQAYTAAEKRVHENKVIPDRQLTTIRG